MCSPACTAFGREYLDREDVAGKEVLEVGSLDVDGSLREVVEPLGPKRYRGVDVHEEFISPGREFGLGPWGGIGLLRYRR